MKTVITHFYNEEYLLPWWLEHHKKYFDHGILIDYASTDRSVEIIQDICPHWQVVKSRNEWFRARDVDDEVMDYEKTISGWKIALNVTEFLVGKFNLLDDTEVKKEYYIPSFLFVDSTEDNYPKNDIPLYEQIFSGLDYEEYPWVRRLRCLHNSTQQYTEGRHYENFQDTSQDFVIFTYGFAPLNEHLISRKLQIQNKIPEDDKINGFGFHHHNYGRGLTKEDLYHSLYTEYQPKAKDLSLKMGKYIDYMSKSNLKNLTYETL